MNISFALCECNAEIDGSLLSLLAHKVILYQRMCRHYPPINFKSSIPCSILFVALTSRWLILDTQCFWLRSH